MASSATRSKKSKPDGTDPSDRSKDNATKAEDVSREITARIFERFLSVNVETCVSTQAPQKEHDNEYYDPRITLVAVHQVIADEARD